MYEEIAVGASNYTAERFIGIEMRIGDGTGNGRIPRELTFRAPAGIVVNLNESITQHRLRSAYVESP
jgi:hypothetical protein